MTTTLTPPGPTTRPPTGPPVGLDDAAEPSRRAAGWAPSVAAGAAVLLAALGMGPLLAGVDWLGWSFVVVLVVCAVGGLLDRARVPLWLVPLAQAVAGTAVLVFAFVPDAPLRFLPSPYALGRLQTVLQDGMAAVQHYATPAPAVPGLVALIALGCGLCALTVHALAVTLRAPVFAGAPLVALYAVPAVVLPDGAPWWAFLLAAAGWLAILVVDAREQVVAWGRAVPHPGDRRLRHTGSGVWAGAATRLGLIAIVAALVVPPFLPGLGGTALGGRGRGSASPSSTDPDSVALDPFVSMRRDLQEGRDVELLTYRTTTNDPAYLRTAVMTTFDGESWIPQSYSSQMDPAVSAADVRPTGISAKVTTTTAEYGLSSSRLDGPYLPLPYPVSHLSVPGDWHWDSDSAVAFSTTASSKGLRWDATALALSPTVAQLQAATSSAPLVDPRDRVNRTRQLHLPQRLVDLANQVTEGYDTPYAKALALQWWFRTQFTYSTEVKGDPSVDQLMAFFDDHVGYCQQFATAMALMARALDIESRVAVGFTPGTEDGSGLWHVSSQDAHAWPELYFTGLGWVRFEPTPRATADGGNVTVPGYASRYTLDQLTREKAQHPHTTLPTAPPQPADSAVADPAAAGTTLADGLRRGGVLAVLVALVLVALAPAAIRLRRRRRRLAARGAALAEAGWAELRDSVTDLGLPWSDADTPRQAEARLRTGSSEDEAAAVHRITTAVERARYARSSGDGPVQVATDLHTIRAGLRRRVDRATRWRARLLPPTVLRR